LLLLLFIVLFVWLTLKIYSWCIGLSSNPIGCELWS